MAIKLKNLQTISDSFTKSQATYTDIHLDIDVRGLYSATTEDRPLANDILLDYDRSAIKNSLLNLFNTRPGQRFLFPEYGLDLNEFLFEAVTEDLGSIIGERIVASITNFEPRVKVRKCIVIAAPDDNLYDITLILNIPTFATDFTLNTNLDISTKSFAFVETSRNR